MQNVTAQLRPNSVQTTTTTSRLDKDFQRSHSTGSTSQPTNFRLPQLELNRLPDTTISTLMVAESSTTTPAANTFVEPTRVQADAIARQSWTNNNTRMSVSSMYRLATSTTAANGSRLQPQTPTTTSAPLTTSSPLLSSIHTNAEEEQLADTSTESQRIVKAALAPATIRQHSGSPIRSISDARRIVEAASESQSTRSTPNGWRNLQVTTTKAPDTTRAKVETETSTRMAATIRFVDSLTSTAKVVNSSSSNAFATSESTTSKPPTTTSSPSTTTTLDDAPPDIQEFWGANNEGTNMQSNTLASRNSNWFRDNHVESMYVAPPNHQHQFRH